MPVQSKAQLKYMAIHHPKILHRWSKEGKLYDKGEKYKDLPYKEQKKEALELVEANPIPGANSTKKTFVEVSYRKGTPGESCSMCRNFVSPASCSKVGGIIKKEGRCDLFSENETKLAAAVRLYRRRQGEAIKQAQSSGVGAQMARILDKTLEENKSLREQLTRMEAGQGAAAAEQAPPEAAPTTEQTPPYQGISGEDTGVEEGIEQPWMKQEGLSPEGAEGAQPGMEGAQPGMEGAQPGMEGMQPPGMPPDQTTAFMELQAQLEQSEDQLEKVERENARLRDENRALGLIVEDPAKIQGPAQTLYDKAGTNLEKIQDIPKEKSSTTKIPRETFSKLLNDAGGNIQGGEFGA